MAADARRQGYPIELSSCLIGSCTNSSYEDVSRAADVARQAQAHGHKAATQLLVTPGSEAVHATIKRDGQMADLENVGAVVLANACGPCIGQWRRPAFKKGDVNTIVTSFNRNFPARNDANPSTMNFIASPEIVMAFGLAGKLSFNPLTDSLEGADGKPFKLVAPAAAPEVPPGGFANRGYGYEPPAEDGSSIVIDVDPKSDRLQLLTPFPAWDGNDLEGLQILVKAKGKCTTDHISPAGPWLRFRGHLNLLSDNTFSGAVNAYTGEIGEGLNQATNERGPFPKTARQSSVAIASEALSLALPQVFMGSPALVVGTSSSRRRAANSDAFAWSFSGPSVSVTPKSGLHGSTASGSNCRRMRSNVSTFSRRASWTCRSASPRLTMWSSSTSSARSPPARAACTASVRRRSCVG